MTAAHGIRTHAETNLKMINNAYTETYIQHSKLTAMLSICLINREEYYYYILFIFLCLARPPLISEFYNTVVVCGVAAAKGNSSRFSEGLHLDYSC